MGENATNGEMQSKLGPQITRMLRSVSKGDSSALGELYESLYPELRRIAQVALYRQGRADSMHTTMLVHESFLRLQGNNELQLNDRKHFFAYAAKTMRHLIIDQAREQMAQWRGGGVEHVTFDTALVDQSAPDPSQPLRVDEALTALEAVDPDLAALVEMRYFGGYTEVEVAELLDISERTVRRRWDKARAWLLVALTDSPQAA